MWQLPVWIHKFLFENKTPNRHFLILLLSTTLESCPLWVWVSSIWNKWDAVPHPGKTTALRRLAHTGDGQF